MEYFVEDEEIVCIPVSKKSKIDYKAMFAEYQNIKNTPMDLWVVIKDDQRPIKLEGELSF